MRRDHLECAVIEQLSGYLADTTLLERALSQAREERRKSTRDRGESGALARQIRETEEARERYFKAFETGLLQPAMLQDRLEALSDKSSALQRRLNALTTDADLPEKIPGSAIAAARDLLGRIHRLAPERGKALLQLLVKEIVIDTRDDARCTYRLPPVRGGGSCNEQSSGDGGNRTRARFPPKAAPKSGFPTAYWLRSLV